MLELELSMECLTLKSAPSDSTRTPPRSPMLPLLTVFVAMMVTLAVAPRQQPRRQHAHQATGATPKMSNQVLSLSTLALLATSPQA